MSALIAIVFLANATASDPKLAERIMADNNPHQFKYVFGIMYKDSVENPEQASWDLIDFGREETVRVYGDAEEGVISRHNAEWFDDIIHVFPRLNGAFLRLSPEAAKKIATHRSVESVYRNGTTGR